MELDQLTLSQLIVGLWAAVVGAIVGGLVSYTTRRRENRMVQTAALFAEFHAPDFTRVRIVAYDALTANKQLGLPELFARSSPQLKAELSAVVHFFEKVALLRASGVLNDGLLKRFFHQYAYWWGELLCPKDHACLADPEWGETLREIDKLFKALGRQPKTVSPKAHRH